ncbi:phosphonopyruvate decarboxylase [Clostridiaceae bacterium OM02-2AC]|nr:phosphonopyruvate decarboxylase [Clostridiaceae bacterium OM02-2AC]
MKIEKFINGMKNLGIKNYIGVPDSTLKPLCDYLNNSENQVNHMVPVNEGAAVALAAGRYVGNKELSCVYMQNSGIGNAINPIASLINEKVYDIPMLFVIGYRGEPKTKDEPQHVFQGEITLPLLQLLGINYSVISNEITDHTFSSILESAKISLNNNKQYAIVVKKNTFINGNHFIFQNGFHLNREAAIKTIISSMNKNDLIVTTTGKISREAYEQSNSLYGDHNQLFLTVGSMGHASMIALGIAQTNPNRRVYCIDGDGAALMHMGSMNYIANQKCENLVHIVLNNNAHESVGGMPTDCPLTEYANLAATLGYKNCLHITSLKDLRTALQQTNFFSGSTFIEVKVSIESRSDLGRPSESAVMNKITFMRYIKGDE